MSKKDALNEIAEKGAWEKVFLCLRGYCMESGGRVPGMHVSSMKYTWALNGGSGVGSHWEKAPGLGLKGCFVLPYRPLSPIHTLTHMRKKNTQRGEEVGHAGWMMD